MYIELNFLVGLIGGIVIGMVIMILLVFVVCMTAIGYLKDDEQDGYPSNSSESPNMEPFMCEKGYAPEEPAMHTETFSQIPADQQMEQDENVGVALEKSPVHHVVRETLVNEDGTELPIDMPNQEIIEE